MNDCKGVCTRYKAHKKGGISWYGNGFKWCQTCEMFLKADGVFCPCCNIRLRNKPKNKKYKEKLRDKS